MPLYSCAALIRNATTETLVSGSVVANDGREAEGAFFGKVHAELPNHEVVQMISNVVPAEAIRSVVEVEGV